MNYCKELNEICAPLIEEIEKDLNKWSFGEQRPPMSPGNFIDVPTISSLGNSTIVQRNVDVFNLQPISNNTTITLTMYKSYDDLGNVIVIRRVLGYVKAREIIESKNSTDLKPILKEMIETLKRDRGFAPDKLNMGIYGTFKRPGSNNEYFREGENFAGFELRLYSATTLAEKFE